MKKKSKGGDTNPAFEWSKPQDRWRMPLRVPVTKGDLNGPALQTECMIMSAITEEAVEQKEFVASYWSAAEDEVSWCESSDDLLCTVNPDGTLVALAVATEEDRARLRVPTWIQDPDWPMCCGRSMHFVGQIDDNDINRSPAPGATLWWHDAASFYVFTCAICLECKAFGQQF